MLPRLVSGEALDQLWRCPVYILPKIMGCEEQLMEQTSPVHEPKPQMAAELARGTVQGYTLHSCSYVL